MGVDVLRTVNQHHQPKLIEGDDKNEGNREKEMVEKQPWGVRGGEGGGKSLGWW